MRGLAAALIGAALVLPSPAPAQQVTLTARDGSLAIEGALLGFDGAYYRVDTAYGELTLDAGRVDCSGPGCPDLAEFVPSARFSGAPAMGGVLLPALIESYADRQGLSPKREEGADGAFAYTLSDGAGKPALHLSFRPTSSAEALADLIANEADFALSLRQPTAEEIARGRDAGIGALDSPLQSQVLALDALVPVVARSSRLGAIDYRAMLALIAGEVPAAEALGLPKLHLTRDLGALTSVLPLTPGRLAAGIVRDATAAALAAAVANDPGALGVARFSALGNTRSLPVTGSCGFSATASVAALKTGDYPLTAPIYLYRPERRIPLPVHEFLTYLLSPQAQPVIRRAGFIDQSIAELPIDAQGRRLAQAIASAGPEVSLTMLQDLARHLSQGMRLTPTFRFEDGAIALTAQSRSSVLLLAQALETGAYDGARIEFLGFSDGNGDIAANTLLAKERADAVLAAVQAAAPDLDPAAISFSTASYGEALPILCDEDDWGARINRRVEVWKFDAGEE